MASSGFSWTLPDHPKLPKGKTVAVVVLDGWGEANPNKYNCIHVAQTPVMDSLKNGAPERWRLVKAHGTAVGLPSDDDMGNSEVGHNALGAGRIYAQGAKLVDLALASGKIYEGEGFNYIKKSFDKGTLHLIGLLSDGGVHSRLDQVQLLLKGASERGAKRIRVHILTDGRDVLDGSTVGFIETLENDLSQLREKGVDARIASGGGRMYVTMDRYEYSNNRSFAFPWTLKYSCRRHSTHSVEVKQTVSEVMDDAATAVDNEEEVKFDQAAMMDLLNQADIMDSNNQAAMMDSDDVRYVLDSLAGETEVEDSLADENDVVCADVDIGEAADVAQALVLLATTKEWIFKIDKQEADVSKLMWPIMLPQLYGDHDDDVCDAATRLLWIAHGY